MQDYGKPWRCKVVIETYHVRENEEVFVHIMKRKLNEDHAGTRIDPVVVLRDRIATN